MFGIVWNLEYFVAVVIGTFIFSLFWKIVFEITGLSEYLVRFRNWLKRKTVSNKKMPKGLEYSVR